MSKVLVVDDSLSVRKVVERALAGRQIEVVCAASGSEAIERLERDAPDVVVCDVVMPDRDGYEICEFIKRHPRLSHTPVLLMSGIVNDEVRERAARAQSAGILAKPFAADDLVRHLDSLLAQRPAGATRVRSEEHTSELQSRSDLVCRLLLEKKKRTASGLGVNRAVIVSGPLLIIRRFIRCVAGVCIALAA